MSHGGAPSRRSKPVPRGKRGWTHFNQIADAKGWKLAEGERVAALHKMPDPEWEAWKEQHSAEVVLKLHCSCCGVRLRNKDGYLLEEWLEIYCERCSGS